MPRSLFSPEILADPYPTYREIRAADPVHWHEPFGAWILTRYDDVLTATSDPRLRAERVGSLRASARPELQPLFDLIGSQMNLNDAPRHPRLRATVSKAFTPHAIDALRPVVESLVNQLLDRVRNQGRLDVIADFAFPLPATVITRLLGLADGDLVSLRHWSDDFATVFGSDPSAVTPEQYERAYRSTVELTEFFRKEFEKRRAHPGSDLLSLLLRAEIDGEKLTETELMANANLLLGAGHETTTHLIGNGLLSLLRHPDQLGRLRADPSLIPNAVEEFLRYDGPVQFMYRLAGEDLDIAGKRVRKGQLVYLMFAAANHDPARYPNPDALDVTRDASGHLAFGHGHHYCLGAPLARLEARIAFEELFRRLPELRLRAEALEYQENYELRGLKTLVVEFES